MRRGKEKGQSHSTAHNERQRDLLDPRYESLDHLIRETFAYDGVIVIDKRTGEPAGHLNGNYLAVSFLGKHLPVHHIAWFLDKGQWPKAWLEIDHANRIGTDNRRDNLREATYGQNTANAPTRSTTGHKGVYRLPNGKYVVTVNTKYHGTFHNLAAAAAKAQEIRRNLYGEFAEETTTKKDQAEAKASAKNKTDKAPQEHNNQLKLWPELKRANT